MSTMQFKCLTFATLVFFVESSQTAYFFPKPSTNIVNVYKNYMLNLSLETTLSIGEKSSKSVQQFSNLSRTNIQTNKRGGGPRFTICSKKAINVSFEYTEYRTKSSVPGMGWWRVTMSRSRESQVQLPRRIQSVLVVGVLAAASQSYIQTYKNYNKYILINFYFFWLLKPN